MTEAPIQSRVRMKASQIGSRLFRNNRGLFLTLDGKRKVRAGLEVPGASDLIGVTPIIITQEMVGMTLGALTVAEVKDEGWTRPTDERERDQENFIEQMESLGAIGFFITDAETLSEKIMHSIREKIMKNRLAERASLR